MGTLSDRHQQVIDAFVSYFDGGRLPEPVPIQSIVEHTGLSLAVARTALGELEARGWVVCTSSFTVWRSDDACILVGEGLEYARRLAAAHGQAQTPEPREP